MTRITSLAEHTPTPWSAEGPDDFGDYNIQQVGEILAIAAVISNLRPDKITAANAAFIVKAVNAHDELVDLVKTLIDNDPDAPIADNGMTVIDGWRERARQLLAAVSS